MGAHVTRATSASEDTAPHWGGGTKKKTAAQMDKKRNKPRVHSGRGDQQADLQTKTQDSSDPTNPPGSRHANALSLPTDKPNEPAGEPPGRPLRLASTSEKEPQTAEGKSKVTLVPNLRWQVQRVQEHMARQRGSTTWSRSETQ